MKNLQKCICTIFLFMAVLAGCKQTVPANPQNDGGKRETPKPNDKPSNKEPGKSDGEKISVKFSLKDENNTDIQLTDSGTSHTATVKTQTATLTVQVLSQQNKVLPVIPTIAGKSTRTHIFSFTANNSPQTVKVSVTHNGSTEEHTVTVDYHKGLIKTVSVTDENGKSASVTPSGNTSYLASVGTKKAKVKVDPLNSGDTVTINGTQRDSIDVEFAGSKTEEKLTVVVKHGEKEETYTVTVFYTDPTIVPQKPILKGITLKNAENESQTFALRPLFKPYNASYVVVVPASVNAIKVEPEADAGISAVIEGGSDSITLVEGDNTIKVKAVQTANPVYAYEYQITVKKAKAGASNNAVLASLEFDSKWVGLPLGWITPPEQFSKTRETYTCTMDRRCNEFYIKAVPEDSNAKITVAANGAEPVTLASGENKQFKPLKNGLNTFVITVTAENAVDTKVYTINAKRPEGSLVLKTFTGSGLSDFYKGVFEEYEKAPEMPFSKTFQAIVSDTATQTTITATPEFPSSTKMKIKINDDNEKEFNGTEVIDLTKEKTGEPGVIKLKIILTSDAVSGDATYYLAIIKKPATGSSDNMLKDLEVSYYGNGYKFYKIATNETFKPEITDYTLTLPHGVQEIRVGATPNHTKASIEGWSGSIINSFDAPFTTVEIPVLAENGNRRVYKLAITELPAATIKITNIPSGHTIDLRTIPSGGLTVEGEFTDPESAVDEIWVGSSGLPIQTTNNGKWVQAEKIGTTKFKAILPVSSLKDLPNGDRDIKVGSFNSRSFSLAVDRVPIIITGNEGTPAAQVTVTIKPVLDKKNNPVSIPTAASMKIYVIDEELWAKGEDVVFATETFESLGDMSFPVKIPLIGIPAGRKCRVEVYIYQKLWTQKDSLLYYGVDDSVQVQAGDNTSEIELKLGH